MKRTDWLEALLFLPAMVMLAAVIAVGAWWLILAGNWLVGFYYGLLHDTLALPHSIAATATVFLVPGTFLGVIRLLYGVRRLRRKA